MFYANNNYFASVFYHVYLVFFNYYYLCACVSLDAPLMMFI